MEHGEATPLRNGEAGIPLPGLVLGQHGRDVPLPLGAGDRHGAAHGVAGVFEEAAERATLRRIGRCMHRREGTHACAGMPSDPMHKAPRKVGGLGQGERAWSACRSLICFAGRRPRVSVCQPWVPWLFRFPAVVALETSRPYARRGAWHRFRASVSLAFGPTYLPEASLYRDAQQAPGAR